MSYIVHVWEDSVPASIQEAERIHRQIAGQQTPQNPKFIALASKLTASFPSDSALEDDDDSVWTDGAINGLSDHAVYGIGIQTAALAVVLPVLVRLAKELQLVVYDMQAARLYRPDGQVFGQTDNVGGALLQEEGLREPLQRKGQVLALLKQALEPVMTIRGFKPNAVGFSKKLKEVEQLIVFDIGDYVTKEIRIYATIELKLSGPLKQIAEDYTSGSCSLVLPVLFEGKALPPFTVRHVGVQFLATFVDELLILGQKLSHVLSEAILPKLAGLETVAGLNQGFGDYGAASDRSLSSLIHGDVLVAYLCEHPALSELIDARIANEQREHVVRKLNAAKDALAALTGM
jgi:hypothetical protein